MHLILKTCKEINLLVFVLIISVSALAQNAPQVKTANGTIEGTMDSGIFVFKGIPYAGHQQNNFAGENRSR